MAANINENGSVAGSSFVTSTATIVTANHPHHGEKPEKFSGLNFKRWQQKMMFYLTTLNLVKFLTEDPPSLKDGDQDKENLAAYEKWHHSEYLCRHYVMNGLSDSLYDVYSEKKSAKNCGNHWTGNINLMMPVPKSLWWVASWTTRWWTPKL